MRIVAANIKPGKAHNFNQQIADGDDVGAYDYASIMHYPRDAFSSNGQDTIVALGGQRIGQRDGLSAGDVAAIRSIYPDLVRPLLFRIAAGADPVARPVSGVPDVLGSSGHRSIAFAVHPQQHERVVLGGSRHAHGGRTDDAALLAAAASIDGMGMLTLGQPLAPGMIGVGVHADVHDLVYSNDGSRLWVACNGGVYRSDRTDDSSGFVPLNDGLPVIEANYVACHPVCEGHVVAGAQDHGALARTGTVWQREGPGRGGGIAFDLKPSSFWPSTTTGVMPLGVTNSMASSATAMASPCGRPSSRTWKPVRARTASPFTRMGSKRSLPMPAARAERSGSS